MNKRGQSLAAFIIVALFVIVISSIIYYAFTKSAGNDLGLDLGQSMRLSGDTGRLKVIVSDCLEFQTKKALLFCQPMPEYESCISSYVEGYFDECLDLDAIRSEGLTIEEGPRTAKAYIKGGALFVDMRYPITISKEGESSRISEFSYQMPLSSKAELELDGSGKTKEDMLIRTADGKAELFIPKGTAVKTADGKAAKEVMLRIAPKHEAGMTNNVVIGMTMYDGTPDGLLFEPHAVFRLTYSPEELGSFPEKSLKLGWYDPNAGFWRGNPTSTVDLDNHILTAEVTHFTYQAAVKCAADYTGAAEVVMGYKGVLYKDAKEDSNLMVEPADNSAASGTGLALIDGESQVIDAQSAEESSEEPAEEEGSDGEAGDEVETAVLADIDYCGCECTGNCSEQWGKLEDYAIINFTIDDGGDACVMELASSPGISDYAVDVRCSDGDECGDTIGDDILINRLAEGAVGDLIAGLNKFEVKLENTDEDECVVALSTISIMGTGIGQEPITCDGNTVAGLLPDCTVQDMINTLCGKGDFVYNDAYPGSPNCEKDSKGNNIGFLDPNRAPELKALVAEAQGVSGVGWRGLPLASLPNAQVYMDKLSELGLTLICTGSGSDEFFGTGGYSTYYQCTPVAGMGGVPGGEESDYAESPKSELIQSDNLITGNAAQDKPKASKPCTSQEKSASRDYVISVIRSKARELGSKKGISGTDLDDLEKYMVGLAMQESSLMHCDGNGMVEAGDNGVSIGVMQVNYQYGCGCGDIYRLECNVECGISHFLSIQAVCSNPAKRVLSSETVANKNCNGQSRVYEGFDCGLRRYNGWACCPTQWPSDPLDCYDYVKKVHQRMASLGLVPVGKTTSFGTSGSVFQSGTPISSTGSVQSVFDSSSAGIDCVPVSLPDVSVNTCQGLGGVEMDSVKDCSDKGGWLIPYTSKTDSSKVCCQTIGCCCTGKNCKASNADSCTAATQKFTKAACATEGKCGKVVDYAHKYAQAKCTYAYIITDGQAGDYTNCNTYGLTCAGFVYSVFNNAMNLQITGHGKDKCSTGGTTMIGTNVPASQLKPGDIFAAQKGSWGHTGIFVGYGTVSGATGIYSSYNTFTPSAGGEPVFIHSIGTSKEKSEPGVSYITYKGLYSIGYSTIYYCRPKGC